jgi:hypothetical protein
MQPFTETFSANIRAIVKAPFSVQTRFNTDKDRDKNNSNSNPNQLFVQQSITNTGMNQKGVI